MSGFTPGPWAVTPYLRPDLDDDPMGVYEISSAQQDLQDRYFAAEPETPELDAVHAENRANVCLISAAPELLDACLWMVKELCDAWDESEEKAIPEKFRQAIAKAEGRTL